jgi:hypothetical protein
VNTYKGWIGVDFDGTLVTYCGDRNPAAVGKPIEAMVNRIRNWLEQGIEVRIFTSRVHPMYSDPAIGGRVIQAFCIDTFGKPLPITCEKDPEMAMLWDDRAMNPNCIECLHHETKGPQDIT